MRSRKGEAGGFRKPQQRACALPAIVAQTRRINQNQQMEETIVNQQFQLRKYPGKGGWTYAAVPQILQDRKAPFGWVKVKGSIDGYAIKNYRLMPMGNGQLFLPVKAAIRKIIGKREGDHVHIILQADNDPVELPAELLLCLLDNPDAHRTFLSYTEGEQKAFIDWINGAKKMETKVERIARTLDKLERRKKFADK